MSRGAGGRGRSWLWLVPAALAACVLNLVLFAAAALLARDRAVPVASRPTVAVNLVALQRPRAPEPEPVFEPPPPPQSPPQLDFRPDLPRPSLDGPDLSAVQIALDPSLLRGQPVLGDFVFEAKDLDQPPRVIARVRPTYPFRARQRNIEGFVEVKLLVKTDGTVTDVTVLASEPEGVFEAAALQVVPRWKFEPGRLDGRPVPSWVVTRVVFSMGG